MKTFPFARFLFPILALFLFSNHGNGQGMIFSGIEPIPDSGIDVSIQGAYKEIPSSGYLPLQVIIENNSGKTRSWDLTSSSTAGYIDQRVVKHRATFTVENGERKVFNLVAPLTDAFSPPHLSGEYMIHLSGYGVRNMRLHFGFGFGSRSRQGTRVGMSESLAPRNLEKLQAASPDFAGTSFDLTLIPPDWRAFSGFDQIWISDDEWRATDAATRLTLLDWVATGGILYICREENDPMPLTGLTNLPENESLTRGFGEIRTHPRHGGNLDEAATLEAIQQPVHSARTLLRDLHTPSSWALLDKLNKLTIRTTLFISFLVLFGIVVGPINVFVFARGSKRFRLFWTTPLISVSASIFIFALILLQDGFGGHGHQLAIWRYFPHENIAIFQQEQASRTGLLLKRDFSVDVPVSLLPIRIETIGSSISGSFGVQQRAFSGDWFRSRSLQGHLLKGVTNTRSRIEITESSDGVPSVLSTFPFPLETVFYLDENGHWWHVENLRSGESQMLEKSDLREFDERRRKFSDQATPFIGNEISRLPPESGQFFAFANASGGTWETLSTIDWKSRNSFHFGPVIFSNP